ncbi:hypothetical protein KP509_01G004200 [Ceratopteris richardii]|uniref:FHA domain-containing protein n=1 Tax=Ceratopteris richardii TaxID=49495 RepID=A0A8T2VID3_CERRI|nr:hypothetical protein KP509_01G004200 [Ceratopteris richardii]
MEGTIAASNEKGAAFAEETYCIRALSVPMRLSASGELCNTLHIAGGAILTIGRSKKRCDVVFEDVRVSRIHCQLRLLTRSNSLVLFDGASNPASDGDEILQSSQFGNTDNSGVGVSRSMRQPYNGCLDEVTCTEQPESFPVLENAKNCRDLLPRNFRGRRSRADVKFSRAIRRKLTKDGPREWKPSLNGIFVNGREFCARMIVLTHGDEISLVGPTEGGKPLDVDCFDAIGFAVESRPSLEGISNMSTSLLQPLVAIQRTPVKDLSSFNNQSSFSLQTCYRDSCEANAHNSRIDEHQPDKSLNTSVPRYFVVGAVDAHRRGATMLGISGMNQFSESEVQAGDSSTRRCTKSNSLDASGRINLLSMQYFEVQPHQVTNKTLADSDRQLLSTDNLVRASMRLRSDLLNFHTSGSSNSCRSLKDTPVAATEKGAQLIQDFPACSVSFSGFTMSLNHSHEEPLMTSAPGESPEKGDVSFSFEHTPEVACIASPQVFSLGNNFGNTRVPTTEGSAAETSFSLFGSDQGNILKGSSPGGLLFKDADANISQSVRSECIPFTDNTVHAIDSLLKVVLREDSIANDYFIPSTTNLGMSENPSNTSISVMKASLEQGIKNTTYEETEMFYSHAGGAVQREVMPATEVTFGEKANDNKCIDCMITLSNNCITKASTQEQTLELKSCNLHGGKKVDASENGHVPIQINTEERDICPVTNIQLPLADVEIFEGKFEALGTAGRNFEAVCNTEESLVKVQALKETEQNDSDFSNVHCETFQTQESACSLHKRDAIASIFSRVDAEPASHEKFHVELRIPDKVDVQIVKDCALQAPEKQVTVCTINVQKDLLADSPGLCNPTLEQENLCKQRVSECILQGELELDVELAKPEAEGELGALDTEACFHMQEPSCQKSSCSMNVQECPPNGLRSYNLCSSNGAYCAELPKNFSCREDASGHSKVVIESLNLVASADNIFTMGAFSNHQQLMTNSETDEVACKAILKQQASGYYLNQLEGGTVSRVNQSNTVRLWDLLALSDDVQALFIATFTYDIEWFLGFSGISSDIPVTAACHNARRCWSKSVKERWERPYSDWPNVTLVYPPFPRRNAFGSRGQGIGCHHPKLFLVRRRESLRVIVSSANLTYKQWFQVSNNVWWQDFPCRRTPAFTSLFRAEEKSSGAVSPDFASQLAMFLAALLVDVPSEAHWVTALADFDFSNASGSLVASVPGLHQPLYKNSPQFLMTLDKEALYPSLEEDSFMLSYLGIVPTMVAGIKYRFRPSADRTGTRIRCLAAALSCSSAYQGSTMPVLLKRAKFLKADPNAVSVIVTSRATGCSQDLFLQQDLHDTEINTMETDTFDKESGFIKLGFLPRDVASWLALLCDRGYLSFAACIWPNEALAVASGHQDGSVKLALYVFQGPNFSALSPFTMTNEECGAFCSLIKSLHNTWGLWRLEKVLCHYNWVDSHETDFYVAAAGRRAESRSFSQESDPQWGCWTAEEEVVNPSISIIFPTINRVIQDNFLHYGLLCFAESAWLRLKSSQLLYDAIPHPPEREGFPMHIKIARRRFQDPSTSKIYGWMYCGSHNFSPAAWGRPMFKETDWEAATDAGSVLGSSLHIYNYELGIVLIEPPPNENSPMGKEEHLKEGLDRFILPFKVPPPIYRSEDKPATGRAIMEAYIQMKAFNQLKAAEEDDAVLQDEELADDAVPDIQGEEGPECAAERDEARAEQVYVEALWSQIDEEDQKARQEVYS